MKKITVFCTAAIISIASIAYAYVSFGKVTGYAIRYHDDEDPLTCCGKIIYPSNAITELLQACREAGGSNVKNMVFVESAYCGNERVFGKGWTHQCKKLVEADCFSYGY
jgi:hypothetical protein